MARFRNAERQQLEKFLEMSSGYVLDFTDRTFQEFFDDTVGINIYDEKYFSGGSSKAKILRTFWSLEDDYLVGKLLFHLVEFGLRANAISTEQKNLGEICRKTAERLMSSGNGLDSLKLHAQVLDLTQLREQIARLESAVNEDPALAIGTAKELVETCCKSILSQRGKEASDKWDVPKLTRETLRELRLLPDSIPDSARGVEPIRVLLSNLASIVQKLAEIRSLYGTGHGKTGKAKSLAPRHARLAVGAASAFCVFVLETHLETHLAPRPLDQKPQKTK